MTITLESLGAPARRYADAHGRLGELVQAMNDDLREVDRRHMPAIRRAIERAAADEAGLRALVESAPELFERPKTVVLHGIRIGFKKGVGRIEFDSADAVVSRIDRKLPELVDQLVRVERMPIKAALMLLSVQQLRAIGCTVEEAGERVVVRAEDSTVDKLVAALVRDARAQAAREEAE